MKKISIIILCFVLLISAAACGGEEEFQLDPAMENEFLKTEYAAPAYEEDFYTGYQIAHPYDANTDVPTESVWVYAWLGPEDPTDMVQTYLNRGYQDIGLMFSLSRDFYDNNYTSQHPEIIQTKSNGSQRRHNNVGGFQVYPDQNFVEYVADKVKPLIEMGVTSLHLEEPDGYSDSCYNDFFKEQWEKKYGEPWEDPNEDDISPDFSYKRDTLIADIFCEAYEHFSAYIKKDYPNVRIFTATHSMVDYAGNHRISSNNYNYLASNANMDGMVIQAWTNTTETPVFYEGESVSMPFENGYIQYNEGENYLRGLSGKRIFSLADASADGTPTPSADHTRPIFEHNIVAQLLMPNIYSYESTVWPDRAFAPMDRGYKAVQEGIIQVQKDIHNYGTVRYGGNNGVGVVMSYTGVSSITNPTRALQAMALPLLTKGIQTEIITLESLTTPESLKDIKVLILSYDFIKPEFELYNQTITDWVQNGGTLIYIGGKNYQQSMQHWWTEKGAESPQAHLFAELGIQISSADYSQNFNGTLNKTSAAPDYFSDVQLINSYNMTNYVVSGDAVKLFEINGETIVFEQKCGKGNVIVAGCEPEVVSSNEAGTIFYEMLFKRALQQKGEQYHIPGAIYAVRGPYEIYHSFEREMSLEGTFIDLFSDDFDVITTPTISPGDSRLFYRVTDSCYQFCNGTVTDLEVGNEIHFRVKNTSGSKMVAVLRLPDGMSEASVMVRNTNSNQSRNDVSVTIENGFVHITYPQNDTSSYFVDVIFS